MGLAQSAEAKLSGSFGKDGTHLEAIAISSLSQKGKFKDICFNAGV